MIGKAEPLTEAHILFLDRHLIIINKEAGWLSQGDKTGDPSVADLAKAYLMEQLPEDAREKRNPFVAPAHRLDRPVSGVLALARTSKAARRLGAQFLASTVTKSYLAVAPSRVPDEGMSILWLKKDRQQNRVRWSEATRKGWQEARTSFSVIHREGEWALVRLQPETGRSHQLRVTLASLQAPIAGDVRYRSTLELGRSIALHAHRLSFEHPVGGAPVEATAPLPEKWLQQWPWLESVTI
jgi:23S rRNA pseudouridine1911/1915/1917 synthase